MSRAILLFTFLTLAIWLPSSGTYAAASQDAKWAALSEGRSSLERVLGAPTFVPVEMEELARATPWFIHYEWLRRQGIEVPPEGLRNPDFAKRVKEAWGWQSRGIDDLDEQFTGRKKIGWAAKYGGDGVGENEGDGRATANGSTQGKGSKTPLAKSDDPYHSNGAVQSIETVDEAIWSLVLDAEMKYGSNLVVGALVNGTYAKDKNREAYFPRGHIRRVNPLRPAHFMRNDNADAESEEVRVTRALKSLLKSLPYPDDVRPADDREALHAGVLELARREATAQAEYYAKRMYFGSQSPSNLGIKGERLDLGDHTAQLGYSKIYRLEDDSPFGEMKETKVVLDEFRSELEKMLPARLRDALPGRADYLRYFDVSYRQLRLTEMVRLAGAPHELIETMSGSGSEGFTAFGRTLLKVAEAGNTERIYMDHAGFKNTGLYHVGSILRALVESDLESESSRLVLRRKSDESGRVLAKIEARLTSLIPQDAELRSELARNYLSYRRDLERAARDARLSSQALRTYEKHAVEMRNRDRTSLIRGDARWKELWSITDRSLAENNPSIVEEYIYDQAAKNVFNFKDAGPYRVVLKQDLRPSEGIAFRRLYDAKEDRYVGVLRIDVASGSGYFKSKKISAKNLESSVLRASLESGETIEARGRRNGDYVEFEFPGYGDGASGKVPTVAGLRLVRSSSEGKAAAMSCEAVFGF